MLANLWGVLVVIEPFWWDDKHVQLIIPIIFFLVAQKSNMVAKMTLPKNYEKIELNKSVWQVPNHFTDLEIIGSGEYGQLSSATDKRSGEKVAIKKMDRPFQDPKGFRAKQALREIRLLKHMQHHENVLSLIDIFSPQDALHKLPDVYLVTPLMGADLSNILKVQTLTDEHVQFIIYQVLRGLKYIHSAGVIHRNLKPSNLAVNENCEVMILDFGMACRLKCWYRAPEIMLNCLEYNELADMWSVGCIMAELLSGKVLFPGNDHLDQLKKIVELVGKPSDAIINDMTNENARDYVRSMPAMPRKDFAERFPQATTEARGMLEQMLKLDPSERPSCAQCLEHPYFAAYHDPDDEPTAPPFDVGYSGDESDLGVDQFKALIFEEIKSFVYTPPEDDNMDQ